MQPPEASPATLETRSTREMLDELEERVEELHDKYQETFPKQSPGSGQKEAPVKASSVSPRSGQEKQPPGPARSPSATRRTGQADPKRNRQGAPAEKTTRRPRAGWYPDPSGGGGQRYWDGTQWTENRTNQRRHVVLMITLLGVLAVVVIVLVSVVVSRHHSGDERRSYQIGYNEIGPVAIEVSREQVFNSEEQDCFIAEIRWGRDNGPLTRWDVKAVNRGCLDYVADYVSKGGVT